jgi:orotidine-5'-phosphate decarboxylase
VSPGAPRNDASRGAPEPASPGEQAAREHLAVAVDCSDLGEAEQLLASVADCVGYAKVGLELFMRHGPAALELARRHGLRCFLDLKLCDIPATVERAVAAACAHGVELLTLHAGGGRLMIEAAAARVARERSSLGLVAVTVLTSLDDRDLVELGIVNTAGEQVLALGKLAIAAGASGLVCSPSEVARLRRELGAAPLLVTPGIRGSSDERGDQKRVATAAFAIQSGANLLVVGRPIRDAVDRRAAARALCHEIASASAS